jgi:hypothetical protein
MAIKVVVVDSAQFPAGVDFSPLETAIDHYIISFENKGILS